MSWRAYRAFLITSALLGGFLMALPVWDWWTYRHVHSESPSVEYPAQAGIEAHPADAAAIVPSAGGAIIAAAMAAPRVQPTAKSWSDGQVAHPDPSQSNRGAETKNPAPAAVVPSEHSAYVRPPASQRGPPSMVAGGVASEVQRPSNTSPLVWVRGLPIQSPLVAPPTEKRPPPADSPTTDPKQESPDPPPDPGRSSDESAPRLSLLPSLSTVAHGKVMSVQVVLSGGEGITSVPFHLKFDPALLEFLGARTGSAFLSSSLEPLLLASVNPERPGDLAVGLALIGDSRSFTGSGSLVVLEFRAIGRGRTDLSFENSSVRGITSEPLPAEFVNTTIEVD